jgi:cell division protein FtsB
MLFAAEIRKRARVIAGPVLGISLAGYFAYHLVEGDRGLIAWLHLTQQLNEAKATQAGIRAEREALDRRVGLLRPEHLDRDMLDEKARETLNLAGAREIVIIHPNIGR